jgi:hypothetical protein
MQDEGSCQHKRFMRSRYAKYGLISARRMSRSHRRENVSLLLESPDCRFAPNALAATSCGQASSRLRAHPPTNLGGPRQYRCVVGAGVFNERLWEALTSAREDPSERRHDGRVYRVARRRQGADHGRKQPLHRLGVETAALGVKYGVDVITRHGERSLGQGPETSAPDPANPPVSLPSDVCSRLAWAG